MKEYNFEYTDQRFGLTLFAFSVLIFIGLIFLFGNFFPQQAMLGMFLAIGVPAIVFLLLKKNIKRQGSANLGETKVELNLDGKAKDIHFNKLASYKVDKGSKGLVLRLKFIDKTKFKVFGNNIFCNTEIFEKFCDDLDASISQFEANEHLGIIRKGSIF